MIKVQLQIGDGAIYDTMDKYGLIYLSSDNIFSPPIKEMEKTSYPEKDGEHIYPIVVFEPFDYKVKFFVNASSGINNANQKIFDFNKKLIYTDEFGRRRAKEITFYNDYKKVKIVGKPNLIQEATEFWRDTNGKAHDIVCVELTIRVSDPTKCDFNLLT